MANNSNIHTYAGIFLFRRKPSLQLLLFHPGGPKWMGKDEGAWSIPLSLTTHKAPFDTAKETLDKSLGFIPEGTYTDLGTSTEESEVIFHSWAVEYQIPDDFIFESQWLEIEWPPDSGIIEEFPEFDRLEYFSPFEARKKIIPYLHPFIPRLISSCVNN